jgi:hypothetical protein
MWGGVVRSEPLTRGDLPPTLAAMNAARSTLFLLAAVALIGCQATNAPADTAGTSDVDASQPAADVPRSSGEPGHPPPLAARGFEVVRSIIHLHSAYSHDACDEEGLDEDGSVNQPCVDSLKAALCLEGISAAFMTDHPSHMKHQVFEELVYPEGGPDEELLRDGSGAVWANVITCPAGQGGRDGQVVLMVGFEGRHTMPIALRSHLDPELYDVSIAVDTPVEEIDALTAGVRAAGGLVTIAHSEQSDLDWEVLANHDISAMEVYNFHANFNVLLEGDMLGALAGFDGFLDPAGGAESDLVGLAMLHSYPEPALFRWREVTAVRPITAIGGSDVHENVLLPVLCVDDLCGHLAEDMPFVVEALKVGGPLMMPDGKRLDSYGRIFRWIQNRVRIPTAATMPEAAIEALDQGRNVVVFEILGDAPGVDLVAETTNDEGVITHHEMGAEVGPGATLWARSPGSPLPGRNALWTDATAAEMTTALMRTTAAGTETLATWSEPGYWRSFPLDSPGAYHLEVTLQPGHLVGALGASAELAERTYRWVETNPIYVTEASP